MRSARSARRYGATTREHRTSQAMNTMDSPYWWENGSSGSRTSSGRWPIWAALRSRFFRNRAPVFTTPFRDAGRPGGPHDQTVRKPAPGVQVQRAVQHGRGAGRGGGQQAVDVDRLTLGRRWRVVVHDRQGGPGQPVDASGLLGLVLVVDEHDRRAGAGQAEQHRDPGGRVVRLEQHAGARADPEVGQDPGDAGGRPLQFGQGLGGVGCEHSGGHRRMPSFRGWGCERSQVSGNFSWPEAIGLT